MNFLNKLERKFGKYAIHNLMYYMVILQVIGIVLYNFAYSFTMNYLVLDVGKVLEGQVWRLFTFIMIDGVSGYILNNPVNIIFLAISLYLYYMIGRSLENVWGAFKFNLYYLSGILLNIVAAFILYFVFKDAMFNFEYLSGIYYVNLSLFLMFAFVFPDMQLMYMFILPIKMKWLGILSGALLIKDIVVCILSAIKNPVYAMQYYGQAIAIVVAILNFIIIFFASRRSYHKSAIKQKKRERQYKRQFQETGKSARHRCAVCGRTELDDPMLEFRYCSKCDGNYEYCMEHLFTHEHIRK